MLRMMRDVAEPVCTFLLALALMLLVSCCAGCAGLAGDGAKIVEGTDLTLGVSLPYADAGDAMTVVNFLTGFRVLVAENARAKVRYSSAATNDWFGVVTSRTHKTIEAEIEPTVENETEETSPARATDDNSDSETPHKEPAGTAGTSSSDK